MRLFRDRDYIETVEGLFFTVVSNLHPKDRVIAYLKYAPSRTGLWGRRVRYARMMPYYDMPSLLNAIKLLEENYPHYVYDCPFMGIKMSAVPLKFIKRLLKPEERLMEVKVKPNDDLEHFALNLAEEISSQAGVSIESLGITGSILLGIHRLEFSDVDLVVYGRNNALKVKKALSELYERRGPFRKLEGIKLEELIERRVRIFHLMKEEALELTRRKWNRGVYEGRDFSMHPVKVEEEVRGRFEDWTFKKLGLVEIEAKVKDSSEALFMPAVYAVEDVEVVEGPGEAYEVVEVVSYEGLYMDVVEPEERVGVRGKLEKALGASGKSYLRVLVGSPEAGGFDYIKPLKS